MLIGDVAAFRLAQSDKGAIVDTIYGSNAPFAIIVILISVACLDVEGRFINFRMKRSFTPCHRNSSMRFRLMSSSGVSTGVAFSSCASP